MSDEICVWNDDGTIPNLVVNEMKRKMAAIIDSVAARFVLPHGRFLKWEGKIERYEGRNILFASVILLKAGFDGGVIKTLHEPFGIVDQNIRGFCQIDCEVISVPSTAEELVQLVIKELDKPFIEEERKLSKKLTVPLGKITA